MGVALSDFVTLCNSVNASPGYSCF